MITITHLRKKLSDKTIFDDLSFKIEEGEFVAIVGPSGCGKTTLLNILGLIDDDYTGEYLLDESANVKANTRRAQKLIRDKISYLFQNFALIEEETVQYNLLLALKYVKGRKADKIVKIKEVLSKLGLEDKLKRKVSELSGGEQQRVALARVILKPGQLILADEPTGSLDKYNRDNVLALLEELNQQGKTIVVVTHDEEVAERCHRTLSLS